MERKIGEIFEYNGEWYQVVECCKDNYPCIGCCGCIGVGGARINGGECNGNARKDNKFVIFKKLEKVGEPFTLTIHVEERLVPMQEYKLYDVNFSNENTLLMYVSDYKHKRIAIEIKQNKEDMEEYRMHDTKEDIPEFEKVVDKCLSGKDKLNLKSFDLEAAKAGKPVCTRDGRKVRIICFDSKNDPRRPIVALVEHNDNELLYEYTIEGKECFSHISTTGTSDLMLLPEKKEGWINVYRGDLYESEEEAKECCDSESGRFIKTVKVEWEE